MKTTYTVYQIRNDVNSKLYIGLTKLLLDYRMLEHRAEARRGTKKPLYTDMRAFGLEHFFIEPLEVVRTNERYIAENREAVLIKNLDTAHPHGYNLRAPLSVDVVALIRFKYRDWPIRRCAQEFGTTESIVIQIRSGSAYPHVEEKHLPRPRRSTGNAPGRPRKNAEKTDGEPFAMAI